MFQNKIKSVRFSNTINMVLIPARDEYTEDKYYLWWNEKELDYIKLIAVTELRSVMTLKNIPYKQATEFLYQPKETTIFKRIEPTSFDLLVHI